MGLFLSLSGVVGGSAEGLASAVNQYLAGKSGRLLSAGSEPSEETAVIAASPRGASIRYPGDFMDWDEASQFLSTEMRAPVFSLHIHDGDLWMFRLFVAGCEVTHFNPLPDYWGEVDARELANWQGDANEIVRHVPDVSASDIERYLVRWNAADEGDGKAYPDDEFPTGSDWQMTDFMRRIGLPYPDDDKHRQTFRIVAGREAIGNATPPARKWWKFW